MVVIGNELKELEASLDASHKDNITFNLLKDTNCFHSLSLEENVCSFERPEQTSLTEKADTAQIQNFEIPINSVSEQPDAERKKHKEDIIYQDRMLAYLKCFYRLLKKKNRCHIIKP